jgi:hypothetical protein
MRSKQSKDLRLLLGVFRWRYFRIGDDSTAIEIPGMESAAPMHN